MPELAGAGLGVLAAGPQVEHRTALVVKAVQDTASRGSVQGRKEGDGGTYILPVSASILT